MKPIPRKAGRKTAFTIIELLTVMSIIVILVGLLVPSLNMVRRYAKRVKQNAQFHAIDVALELFYNEWDGYPPSDALDAPLPKGQAYCGAMKLAEAMLGQDLRGFDPDSRFLRDASFDTVPVEVAIYNLPLVVNDDLSDRRKYLPVEHTNFYSLGQIYDSTQLGPFVEDPNRSRVLYDEYTRGGTIQGRRIGMPVLYYRANTSNTGHNEEIPDDPTNIYRVRDNIQLLRLGVPKDPAAPPHPMFTKPELFYQMTRNDNITVPTPYRSDSYILMSAGWDGLYGTKDDIYNFERLSP